MSTHHTTPHKAARRVPSTIHATGDDRGRHASAAGSAFAPATLRAAFVLVTAVLLLMIVRLPWIGDLGVHAATLQRLRTDLLDPGNPMVDAHTPSPYYSPWMVLLALLAKTSGLGTFVVLRIAAVVGLALLLTGIWRFTRTLSSHPAAPPLAALCLLFLWGPRFFIWSGYLGFTSLSVNISYPSTFALGLSLHFWSLLAGAVRNSRSAAPASKEGFASCTAFLGLGILWATILLCHPFTGVVATFGALGVFISSRPWPARQTWLRLAAGAMIGLAVLAAWPYYDFFALFTVGGLESIHESLYDKLVPHYAFAALGVIALYFRFRRDHRDCLVIFFALGALMFTAGGLTGHWSWGRAMPAAVIPAQLAAALATVEGGTRVRRKVFVLAVGAALLAGAWAQRGALTFVLRGDALPHCVGQGASQPWARLGWMHRWVAYGDTVMVPVNNTARMLPGYGYYTVAPGYPDFFLPDEQQRYTAVTRYYAPGTPHDDRLDILHRYHVQWILRGKSDGGLAADDPALSEVWNHNGQTLYRVTG